MRVIAKSVPRRLWIVLFLTTIGLSFALFTTGINQVNAKKEKGAGRTAKTAPAVQVQQVSEDPSVSGNWVLQSGGSSVDTSWPVTPVHINLLPNGKFLFWGRDKAADGSGFDIEGFTTVRLWDPFYRTFLAVDNTRTNLFCSGHSLLPDGRLLVAGGHEVLESKPLAEGLGSKHTNIFDFRNNTWTAGPDMNNGRWYPFNVTLGTGETMIVSGSFLINPQTGGATFNRVPQVFTTQGTLRNLTTITHASFFTLPHLHLLASSNVLMAPQGPAFNTFFINSAPPGSWSNGPNLQISHDTGTSVTYADGKILVAGGRVGDVPHKQVELFDVATGGFQPGTSMKYERTYPTATLLPDGKVLVSGGTTCTGTNNVNGPTCAVKNPELWNPADGTWTEMKPHQEVRVYHSTAILMPDGRVMVGGGGLPGADGENWSGDAGKRKFAHQNVEIFEPPYLFNANGTRASRPEIAWAPKEVTYDQAFTVGLGNVTAQEPVEAAVLIRLGAVTHGFNQDQRRVPLTLMQSPDGLSATLIAPNNPWSCPPGYYMLFVLRRNGANLTPSVAKIIRVNKSSPSSTLQVFASASESRSLNITATPDVSWSASVTAGSQFITISGPTGQVNGSGTLNFSVAPNSTGIARSGKIVINVAGASVLNQEISIYQGKAFTDVLQSGSEDAAGKISAVKISGGCGGSNFCPNRSVTRGEIAVFFVAAALGPGVPVPPATSVTFFDVSPSHQFYNFIEDFYKRGFTAGCGGGNFCPSRTVRREELAAFLVRALGITARATTTQTFTDVEVADPFHKVIEEVVARGLMTGCGSDQSGEQFCPNQEVTRLEVAQALVKAYGF